MYIGQIPTPTATESRQEFTATSGQIQFQTTGGTEGYCDCFLNGVKLDSRSDFSFDGSTVTLTTGAAAGDVLAVVMRQADSALVALPIKDSAGNNVLSESGGVVSIDGTFNGTIGTTASLPAGTVVQTEYQYVDYNGVPTGNATTNVGSSVTVLYPCTKILCQIVVTVSSPLVYANYGTYSINIQTDATISVSNTSTVGPNNSFVGADLAQDGENVYGTLTSSKLFIRNSGSPSYYNTGDTFQPSITVGPVYGGSYFYEMGIHIYFIK